MVGGMKLTQLKISRPPTLASITITLAAISAALFLVGIWTGDARWAQTAAVALIPGLITGFTWVVQQVWKAGL
jgi:hypothetical protein